MKLGVICGLVLALCHSQGQSQLWLQLLLVEACIVHGRLEQVPTTRHVACAGSRFLWKMSHCVPLMIMGVLQQSRI